MGFGSPVGTLGFVNAIYELQAQIKREVIPEPDVIYVPCGTGGTAAGLITGCKLLDLNTKIHAVAVSTEPFSTKSSIIKNCNKSLKYMRKCDDSVPSIEIKNKDFTLIRGYLGSDYGIKTESAQSAVDLVTKLEGKDKGFKLETTYTGKTMAAMLDYIRKNKNKSDTVLFWNTYNSNDLDNYVKETQFDYESIPKQFHQFYTQNQFQCWQIEGCPKNNECKAYLNHEYRCWKVKNCSKNAREQCEAYKKLKNIIQLEDI